MQVNAKVIAALEETAKGKNPPHRPYTFTQFTFKTEGGRGAETKNIMPFKQKELAAKVLTLQPGEVVTITMEKPGEYWEIMDVTRLGEASSEEAPEVAAKTVTAGTTATATPSAVSGTAKYNSMQDDKQIMIVRQSSLGHAVATLTANKGSGGYTSDDVIITAQEYVDFVLNGPGVSAPAPAPVAITKKPASKRNHAAADDLVEDEFEIPL